MTEIKVNQQIRIHNAHNELPYKREQTELVLILILTLIRSTIQHSYYTILVLFQSSFYSRARSIQELVYFESKRQICNHKLSFQHKLFIFSSHSFVQSIRIMIQFQTKFIFISDHLRAIDHQQDFYLCKNVCILIEICNKVL